MKESVNIWSEALLAAMTTLWSSVAAFAPHLVAALLILAVGYLIARALRAVTLRVATMSHLDEIGVTTGIAQLLDRANLRTSLSEIVAALVFWTLMLIVFLSAAETLGLVRIAGVMDDVVLYLPKVFGAMVILVGGLMLVGFARNLVISTADSLGIEYAGALGSVVYGLLATIVMSLAIGQLELEIEILNHAITILLLSGGAAGAIAFGFGAREITANVLAATYVRELYREDDVIRVDDLEGSVVSIGSAKTVIETSDGTVSVPNSHLVRSAVLRRR